MRIICPLNSSCTIVDCPHKIPHYPNHKCYKNCDGTLDSKCAPTLKSIRQEKLKRIQNENR